MWRCWSAGTDSRLGDSKQCECVVMRQGGREGGRGRREGGEGGERREGGRRGGGRESDE